MEPRYPPHFNPDSGLYYYTKVDAQAIDTEQQRVAENALRYFARDLKIDAPSLQWILPEPWKVAEAKERESRITEEETDSLNQCEYFHETTEIFGLTPFDYTGEILIRGYLGSYLLIRTIAHELRHCSQEKQHGSLWRRNEADTAEEEADDYANQAIQLCPEYLKLSRGPDLSEVLDPFFESKVADLKTELEKLLADRQEQLGRELEEGKED